MIEKLKPYGKLIAALFMLIAALVGRALGADTGVNLAEVGQDLLTALLVFLVPNQEVENGTG